MLFPACTARASQLESRVSTLENALAKQEEILVAAQEEMQEKISAADERSIVACSYHHSNCWFPRYAGLRSVNIHLEGNILELQERWVRRLSIGKINLCISGKRREAKRKERGKS